jgi:hypothetical protein
MRRSATGARWCGFAAGIAGLLLALKGVVQGLGGADLDLLPFIMPLFAIGLVGLYHRLPQDVGRLARVSGGIAYLALAVAGVGLASGGLVALDEIIGVEAVPDAAWPIHVVALASVFPLVVIGAVALGLAVHQATTIAAGWRDVPLAVGVTWIPLFLIGEVVGDWLSPDREIGLGFVLAGLVWFVFGAVVWLLGSGARVARWT